LGQAVTKTGTWSAVGAPPSEGTGLSDGLLTTGLQSVMTATEQSVRATLEVAQAKTAAKYFCRVRQSGAATIIGRCRLFKGATEIAEGNFTPATDGSDTLAEFDLTSGELAAIGTTNADWADLRVEVAGSI
jgi:hypothetical protein